MLAPWGSREHVRTILVVEDNALIRLLAVELLTEAGHVVHQAPNARTALKIIEANAAIDVLFTDVSMPIGMNGVRLAATVRQRWPAMDIIVTSGERRPDPGDLPIRGIFLPKPYEPGHVLAAIEGRLPV